MIWQIYLVLAVLFMGFNSFIVKKLVKKVKPNVVMLYQFMLATPLVASYNLLTGGELIFNPLLLLLGFGYFCSLTLFYVSLVKGSLTRAGPIWTLNLLISAILGFIILHEPLNLNIALGLLFGVVSVYLLR
ncbi:EamA-like transporter family protein [Candidatus Tiddalikarchaeum anstoanum]|nr:EamA-like transporter family protein [Candidatus Tiddalikarchaeum anstoanum]